MYKQRNTPMEKVIGQSVERTNQVFLNRYVDDYCKALTENFKQDTIRSLEHNLKRDPDCTYSAEPVSYTHLTLPTTFGV